MRISSTFALTVGSTAVLVLPLLGLRPAPSTTAVSGAFTLTYVSQVAAGTNGKGAAVFVSTAQGTNRNTGVSKYLSDARVAAIDTAAMIEGSGTHSGQVTFSDASGTVVKVFTGATTTRMVNGRPESTFKGTWTVISGAEGYAGMTGTGTYTGRFNTSTEYTVEWKGDTSR